MARKKVKRKHKNQKHTKNCPRAAKKSPAQETVGQLQECSLIQAKTPEVPVVPPAPAAPTEALQVPTTEVLEPEKETLSKFVTLRTIIECQEDASTVHVQESVTVVKESSAIATKPQENSLEKDNHRELRSPILGCRKRTAATSRLTLKTSYNDWTISGTEGAAGSETQPNSNSIDDSHNVSCDSPLNLTWDSMKENCRQQANAPNFRPITPDNLLIPVDEILSPKTQHDIRTTIRVLFPNGPPAPPPVRKMRRPKKGDLPYIVNCNKRSRVPSPKGLNVFTGDKYGITSSTNCDEDEQCTPEKIPRRGLYGSSSIKSTFNQQSNEIAERLKLYERIDRLVGRTPKEQPVEYMKHSFSPLPSTSTDIETIMINDKHFGECFNYDNFDEDEELPEVVWETDITSSLPNKKEKDEKGLSTHLVSTYIHKDNKNYTDNIMMKVNEDINNNDNDVIAIEDEFCEIQFDKLMPKEKILYYDDEPRKEPEENSKPSNDVCPITSSHAICVDDICTTNLSKNVTTQASANSVTFPVLRASNSNATATVINHSDVVIENSDVLEPMNMSRHAHARPTSWNGDVKFVSEERIERPNNSTVENIPNRQIIDVLTATLNNLQRLRLRLTPRTTYRRRKSKHKRTMSKGKLGVPCNTENALAINDENTAPINIENASSVNNENVNQEQQLDTSNGSAHSTQGKGLGICPICLDNLPRGSIASTNCGHVFCLECIKQSLKTSGKRCPTCRKPIKGVGFHQVFL